jgi:predicted O-methyltransferase YrrM
MKKTKLRKTLQPVFPVLDLILSPFTLAASLLLLAIRKMRVYNMPVSKKIFKAVGVFPISKHYYEPLFDDRMLKYPLDRNRNTPGINWNSVEQLKLLENFNYQKELLAFPMRKKDAVSFFYENPSLGPGDAEYLYCMIRHFKPARIIEIGSGYSTLLSMSAIAANKDDDNAYECRITCIEPFEMSWLEGTGVEIIRRKVEEIELSFFQSLGVNDFLFIDSSHVIRPQGDVLFEILEILPTLAPGVIIHLHDIFSPGDYTEKVVRKGMMFWNEQYLLEAFLSCNEQFRIIGGLNYLKKNFRNQLFAKLPVLKNNPGEEPGSFWIRKN